MLKGQKPIWHGLSATPEYAAWNAAKFRCINPKDKQYGNYGGRGIAVCSEWLHDFPAFLAHVGKRPTPKHSLDRINNDHGYEPGNVRWATQLEQRSNQRNKRLDQFTNEELVSEIRRRGLHA